MSQMNFLVPLQFAEGDAVNDIVWLEALEAKTYHTPFYGEVTVTPEKLHRFADNFKKNVRGVELATDYNHGDDPAKGKKASGWIKDLKIENNKLLYGVHFTDTAKKEIEAGEWKYFSADWLDEYTHEDGTKHQDVLLGGGLTNRPIAKSLMPINFSEVFVEAIEVKADDQESNGNIEAVNPAEFMEPGSGNIDYSMGDNDDSSPNRIDTPPPGEDGSVPDRSQTVENKGGEMDEFEKQLRDSLGVADDVDVSKYITDGLTKLEGLETAAKEFSEHKAFAEQYPDEHKRMVELEEANRELKSKQFSEGLIAQRVMRKEGETEVASNLGLSALAIEKAGELHKKFSEGTATLSDFSEFTNTLFSDGIVEYGERGSTQGESAVDDTVPNGNVTDIRKAFAEKVDAVGSMEDHKDKDYGTRVAIAAAQNPKLYEAYLNAKTA